MKIAAVALVLSLAAGAASAASRLAPHSAYYGISLTSVREGSNVNGVTGEMAIRWEGDCSGWTMTHRMVFDVGYVDGDAVRITMDASTWEARDGDRYTFTVRTRFNDREVDRIEGHARRSPSGNEAVFSAPGRKVMKLPADVVFPTRHTQEVIAAARHGRKILPATVFDGFSEDGAFLVNAVIGRPVSAPSGADGGFPGLEDMAAWNVQLAFFPEGSQHAAPQSEIGILLYDNGVARRLDMGFDDFDIRADLRKLELDSPPACDG